MSRFTKEELSVLQRLRTPERIQDFLDGLPMNFELKEETCLSPRRVLREKTAHCMEGAMLAAACLRLAGHRPLVMDLKSRRGDDDHIVAVFKRDGCFGAISKTNHAALRYRDAVYRTPRELALSFFHEYFLEDGTKTLRSYTLPFSLAAFDALHWETAEKDLWIIPRSIDRAKHIDLLSPAQVAHLRKADVVERTAGAFVEWTRHGRRNVRRDTCQM